MTLNSIVLTRVLRHQSSAWPYYSDPCLDLSAGLWPSMTAELCTSLLLLYVFYFSRVFFNVVFELIGENVFLFNYFRILRLRGPKAGLYVSINYRLDSIIQSVQWSQKVKATVNCLDSKACKIIKPFQKSISNNSWGSTTETFSNQLVKNFRSIIFSLIFQFNQNSNSSCSFSFDGFCVVESKCMLMMKLMTYSNLSWGDKNNFRIPYQNRDYYRKYRRSHPHFSGDNLAFKILSWTFICKKSVSEP